MSSNDFTRGITTQQITVGATMMVGITAGPCVNSMMFKLHAGGGTCTILGISLLNGTGYAMDPLTPFIIGGDATVYINEKAGVTSIISVAKTINSIT